MAATIKQALKGVTNYPVQDDTLQGIALCRGLSLESEATAEVLNSESYALATADIYSWLAIAPNVSEGGVSFSFTQREKETFRSVARSIYQTYGINKPGIVTYGNKGDRL